MTNWSELPPAEHHEGFTLPSTVANVSNACREAARDMGLALVEEDSTLLTFRDRFHWLAFPVELVVGVRDDKGGVRVSIGGSSWGGKGADQLAYVARLVHALAGHVRQEARAAASSMSAAQKKRNRRAMFALLTAVQWLPMVLLVPMAVVPFILWDGLKPRLLAFGWGCLLLLLPPTAEVIRRRLAGTGSRSEFVPLAVGVGIVVVYTVVALGKALGWF